MNASKEETKELFNNSKYGMFIHWGLYSIPGGVWEGKKMEEMGRPNVAEWVQYVAKIPRDEYAKLAPRFNPTDFDADAIAKLAKDAGMKYLVVTSKHHDGFALYDSKVSEYDIMDASPFKRDIVQELYGACKKYGIDFGLYYSHNIDWMDGGDCQYSVFKEQNDKEEKKTQKFGPNLWDPSPNTFEEYLENKAYPQVKEILTKFPGMTTLWYDMARYMKPEQSAKFYKIAYDIQPQMLINERVGNDMGDFDIPGDNQIPQDHLAITKPWQTVGTLNNSWGYKSYDNDWKSVKELLFWLTEIVSKGGNYMLNIGPMASGEVPKESIENLREVGKWLAINGEAIYNTKKWRVTHEGPTDLRMDGTNERQAHKGINIEFTAQDFWFTKNGNKLFAISLENSEKNIVIKSLAKGEDKVKYLKILGADSKIKWNQTEEGLKIELPENLPSNIGYALEITLK
jgi:alpha-L-fucosidase